MPDWLTYLEDALVSAFFGILGYAGVHLSAGTGLGAFAAAICYVMILFGAYEVYKNLRGMAATF